MPNPPPLSRRERQIMEIVYRQGPASAADIRAAMADAPSYSTVRALLRVLVEKGHLRHEGDGARYVYTPIVPRRAARKGALTQLVEVFFDGSAAKAASALLSAASADLSQDELDELSELIEAARKKGR